MAILILTFAILSIPIDVLFLPLILWLAVPTAVLFAGLLIVRRLTPRQRANHVPADDSGVPQLPRSSLT